MKKVLSIILCAAMLVGGMTFAVGADDVVDKAMLIDDISVEDTSLTGSMGYIVNNRRQNAFGVKSGYAPYAMNGMWEFCRLSKLNINFKASSLGCSYTIRNSSGRYSLPVIPYSRHTNNGTQTHQEAPQAVRLRLSRRFRIQAQLHAQKAATSDWESLRRRPDMALNPILGCRDLS